MAAPLVTVRGEAQLEGPPDLATLTCTVLRHGPTLDGVRSELGAASGRLSELLAPFGPVLERTSTSGLHVSPVLGRSETKIKGYRGSFTTELIVSDFAGLSDLVYALAPLGDSQLDGPFWSLRPDNPLHRQVRLAAIADARRRADDYALAFEAHVVDLVEVSDTELGLSGGRSMRTFSLEASADGQPEFDFQPPTQTVSGQVTVRFTLSQPDLAAS